MFKIHLFMGDSIKKCNYHAVVRFQEAFEVPHQPSVTRKMFF